MAALATRIAPSSSRGGRRTTYAVTACPALESGDRMDAEEFHWRYSLRPDIKNAELIRGVVYVACPVNFSRHGSPHVRLIIELGRYLDSTPGVLAGDNSSLLLGGDSEPQPDVALVWDSDHGGHAEFDEEGNLISAPDLVAEVSYSSKSYDLHDKKDLYERIGVQEYIVWQVEDGRIDWWQLVDGKYEPIAQGKGGVVSSVVFPGLSLDIPALLKAVPAAKLPKRPRKR